MVYENLIYVTLLLSWQQIVTSLWRHRSSKIAFEAIQKCFFVRIISCCSLNLHKLLYQKMVRDGV